MEAIIEEITREVVFELGKRTLELNGKKAEDFVFRKTDIDDCFVFNQVDDRGFLLNLNDLTHKEVIAKEVCYMLGKANFAYSELEVEKGIVGLYAKDKRVSIDYLNVFNASKDKKTKKILEKLKLIEERGFSVFWNKEGFLCICYSLVPHTFSIAYLKNSISDYIHKFSKHIDNHCADDFLAYNKDKIVKTILDEAIQEEVTVYEDLDYSYSRVKEDCCEGSEVHNAFCDLARLYKQ